jgi:uncharacterized protein YciI
VLAYHWRNRPIARLRKLYRQNSTSSQSSHVGSAWDDAKPANEQIGFKEHSENLRRLRSEKRISIGGRYGDKGMVIVEDRNEADARSLFASDLMVLKKTFTLELQQFRPFYKGSIE